MVEAYIVREAPRLAPADVRDFLVAFEQMETKPEEATVNAALFHLSDNLHETQPRDLAQLLNVRPLHPYAPAACFQGCPGGI